MRLNLFYLSIVSLLGMNLQAQNYITIYADCNYGGTSQMLKEGRYSLGQTRIGNGNLSSMRIPSGFKVTLYDGYEPGQGGQKMNYTSETSCLSSSGWNNKANAIVVERTSAVGNNNNNGDYSNNNLVTIFSECNYRGNSKFFREGRYSMNDLGIGDDQLSSIKVPSGWSITIYLDPNQRGNSTTYSSDMSCLPFGWNNKTSSISVQRGNYNNNNNNNNSNNNNYLNASLVTLYADCYYRGARKSFREGRYSMEQLGIGDDQLSSIKVPSGYSITIYQDPNQRGGNNTYSSDIVCLPAGWDNRTSSIVIQRGNYNNNNNNNNFNNNRVTLFSDCNYQGNRKSFNEGRYSLYELGIGDDELSSIMVPSGWSITIYQDPNQRGNSMTYTSGISCLPSGWNNKTSSIAVRRGYDNDNDNNNNNNGVTLFSDCNFRGTKKSFGEGRYSMYELGVGDDETSSIRVSNGWTVTIYQDPNQRGGSANYSSDINCLPSSWNNKTSSIWVRRTY